MLISITDLLFHPLSNAIMTVLAGITAIYWIFTFIAGDLFGDTDVDAGVEVDGADVDTEKNKQRQKALNNNKKKEK